MSRETPSIKDELEREKQFDQRAEQEVGDTLRGHKKYNSPFDEKAFVEGMITQIGQEILRRENVRLHRSEEDRTGASLFLRKQRALLRAYKKKLEELQREKGQEYPDGEIQEGRGRNFE